MAVPTPPPRPSHLTMETPSDTAVSMTLAVGGGVLVVLLTAFAPASLRRRPEGPAGTAPALRSGVAVLLVALASGTAMIARGAVPTRTGHQEAAYRSAAPLKPLHDVSLHAAWYCPRRPGCPPAPLRTHRSVGGPSPPRPASVRRRSPAPQPGRASACDVPPVHSPVAPSSATAAPPVSAARVPATAAAVPDSCRAAPGSWVLAGSAAHSRRTRVRRAGAGVRVR